MANKFLKSVKNFFIKVCQYLKKARIEFIVILLSILVDLVSKGIIQATMSEGETIVIIPNFLEFYFTYNKSAAFSFDFGLSSLVGEKGVTTVFIIVTFISVALFGFIMYKLKNRRLFARLSLALIIGGAIGNLYDRIAFSMVRDFIKIVYFGLEIPYLGSSFAVFNIADACLVVGAISCVVYVLFLEGKDKRKIDLESVQKRENESAQETENESAYKEKFVDTHPCNKDDMTEKGDNVVENL